MLFYYRLQNVVWFASKNVCYSLENHIGFHSREILDDEGDYGSFAIVGNFTLHSVHTQKLSENDMKDSGR